MGSWLGGALALGGAEVTLVARGAHGVALASDGLRVLRDAGTGGNDETDGAVLDPAKDGVAAPTRVVGSIADAWRDEDSTPFDIGLIAVKSYDAPGVAREIVDAMAEGAAGCRALATFQNGVGSEAHVAAVTAGVIDGPVIAGTLTTSVRLAAPGVVAGRAKGGVGVAGGHPAADALARTLVAGGLRARRYEDEASMKWSKLLLNMLGSATSAIVGRPPAELFRHRGVFDLEVDAWREAVAVMRAVGLRPVALPGYPVPAYATVVAVLPPAMRYPVLSKLLAGSRGSRLPGVAADIQAGRTKSEARSMGGAVAELGAAIGRPAPVNRALTDLLVGIAEGRIDREPFVARPDSLVAAVRSPHEFDSPSISAGKAR